MNQLEEKKEEVRHLNDLLETQRKELEDKRSNEWSYFGVLPTETKVRKLCITQGLTLEVKGLSKQIYYHYMSMNKWSLKLKLLY